MTRWLAQVLSVFLAGVLVACGDSTVWRAPDEWNVVTNAVADALRVSGSPLLIPSDSDSTRFQVPISTSLSSDPVYQLVWEARAVGGASATLEVKVGIPSRKKKATPLKCGPALTSEWTSFSVPFTLEGFDPNAAWSVLFQYGWGEASAEVREVRIEVLGTEKPLTAYERTGRWYHGNEADAAWRKKAQEQIEAHRKSDLTLTVVDELGKPIPDVRIIAEQQSHAYRFGTAVDSQLFRWVAPDAHLDRSLQAAFEYYRQTSGRTTLTFLERQAEIQTYFNTLRTDFNFAVLENALKWEAWSGAWGGIQRENTLAMIDWLRANKIGVKAHALIWPGWGHVPAYVKELSDDPEALRAVIDAHFSDLGVALNGRVETIDVLNEAFNNHHLMDLLGEQEMTVWFQRAKELFPKAQLNMNDFLLMANGGQWSEKLDFYDSLAERLLADGAPLEGIGFQSHFRHSFLTAPERIWELCDRFGRFEIPLICSEFDVNLPDEKLQAEYTRDFMTAWFAHPSTTTFMLWGFWQDAHWLPYGGLYDRDWRMKPNAQIYRDLVFEQWWSGWEEVQTGTNGVATVRGFFGTYRISLYSRGKEKVLENIPLNKEGLNLTVRL